jgi:hypothetical protein
MSTTFNLAPENDALANHPEAARIHDALAKLGTSSNEILDTVAAEFQAVGSPEVLDTLRATVSQAINAAWHDLGQFGT